MKDPPFSKGKYLLNNENKIDEIKKNLLLKNHGTNFSQTWHKTSLGEGDPSFVQMEGPPFSKDKKDKPGFELVTIHVMCILRWRQFLERSN